MFCSSCGKEIPDDSIFCPQCGTTLATAPAKAASGQRWSKGVMVGLVIATLFFPPVGIILWAINLNDDNKKGQTLVLLILAILTAVLNVMFWVGQ